MFSISPCSHFILSLFFSSPVFSMSRKIAKLSDELESVKLHNSMLQQFIDNMSRSSSTVITPPAPLDIVQGLEADIKSLREENDKLKAAAAAAPAAPVATVSYTSTQPTAAPVHPLGTVGQTGLSDTRVQQYESSLVEQRKIIRTLQIRCANLERRATSGTRPVASPQNPAHGSSTSAAMAQPTHSGIHIRAPVLPPQPTPPVQSQDPSNNSTAQEAQAFSEDAKDSPVGSSIDRFSSQHKMLEQQIAQSQAVIAHMKAKLEEQAKHIQNIEATSSEKEDQLQRHMSRLSVLQEQLNDSESRSYKEANTLKERIRSTEQAEFALLAAQTELKTQLGIKTEELRIVTYDRDQLHLQVLKLQSSAPSETEQQRTQEIIDSLHEQIRQMTQQLEMSRYSVERLTRKLTAAGIADDDDAISAQQNVEHQQTVTPLDSGADSKVVSTPSAMSQSQVQPHAEQPGQKPDSEVYQNHRQLAHDLQQQQQQSQSQSQQQSQSQSQPQYVSASAQKQSTFV
jgi:hypothetical protein